GLRAEPGPGQLRRPRLRLRRGTLDGVRGQRRGRARLRADGVAVRALRLPRRGRVPEQGALRHALRLRRARGEEVSEETRSDPLVFFGATGDLAYKKIFPALQQLIKRGRLDAPII